MTGRALCSALPMTSSAIEAFERGAVDYLLKPVEEERLAVTLDRLRKGIDTPPDDVTPVIHLLNSQTPRATARPGGSRRWSDMMSRCSRLMT